MKRLEVITSTGLVIEEGLSINGFSPIHPECELSVCEYIFERPVILRTDKNKEVGDVIGFNYNFNSGGLKGISIRIRFDQPLPDGINYLYTIEGNTIRNGETIVWLKIRSIILIPKP